METITIPSPTAFLASPVLKPAPEPPLPPKPKHTTSTRSANASKKATGTAKPKQSKSRNGCMTCKAKRLKCDETHPTCQQCHKRSVTCGGYKKDFKWRPFEETTFINKTAPPKTKRTATSTAKDNAPPAPSPSSDGSASTPRQVVEAETTALEDCFPTSAPPPPPPHLPIFSPPSFLEVDFSTSPSNLFDMSTPQMSTPQYARELPRPRIEPDTITRSLSSLFEDNSLVPPEPISRRSSGQSPRLIDLLLPGSELNARPGTVTIPPLTIPTPAVEPSPVMDQRFLSPIDTSDVQLADDVEEIIRDPEQDLWMSLRSPVSLHSPESPVATPLYLQPEVQAGSPEMLMLRFDKQTCGILSVKDGPTENPWRTLVWPLARDSPALYHAIASMTAFHTSKERPALRVEGMEHMRRSIRSLATGIEKMRTDTALATTLVLAFSESWDQHISTGIEHLRGARILVNRALSSHRKRNLSGDDLDRLRFLCNTFIYMDVIARLTSSSVEAESFDVAALPVSTTEIDPLMGLASTLFPIIGRVANLCRKVRTTATNSIAIIGQAIELKEAIVQWSPPPVPSISQPEDPTAEIQHALQTAEAYRYATLLYLHQAVPEIPSWTSERLAQKVLVYLATVPLSSRLVIIQIYPLLAAGCEVTSKEDREWVEKRWEAMSGRMWIGNIDRCYEVMQEVWTRRDEAAALQTASQAPRNVPAIIHSESSKRKFEEELALQEEGFSFSDMLNGNVGNEKRQRTSSGSRSFSAGTSGEMTVRKRMHEDEEEGIERQFTVRGKLHWIGVMRDWDWEIKMVLATC